MTAQIRQHMGRIIEHRPRYQSAPYRQHPGRRQHIYGELQPMETETEFPTWLKVMVAAFAVPAAMLLIGGM